MTRTELTEATTAVAKAICKARHGQRHGCLCNGDPQACRAVDSYAREAAAAVIALERYQALQTDNTEIRHDLRTARRSSS